jgi:aerobic-type carbon monoxide dehydrogenase small subunit (CoxS/CutS family)
MTVNGAVHEREVDPRRLLSDFLRDDLGLTGTHVGCEQGVCGACTVQVNGEPVRSCLMFAVQARGCDVRTVEDLAAEDGTLHPLQEAFRECHALQCGFCTPGFLMSIEPVLPEIQGWSEDELREYLGGNICRCTGYQHIVDAVQLTVRRYRGRDFEPAATELPAEEARD